MDPVARLLASEVILELHALLWTKGRLNFGEWDGGWSCREHAVSVASLLTLDGAAVFLRHGRCMFVQGPSGERAPVALGQEASRRVGHSWAWVEGLGDLDVSPRLREGQDRWRPLVTDVGVVGERWPVDGITTTVAICDNRQSYENAIAVATYAEDVATAVYWAERQEPFTVEMLVDGVRYLNSPLTSKIKVIAGEDVYIKLVAHLRGVFAAERQPLRTVSVGKAWRIIGEINDDETGKLLADLTGAIDERARRAR